MAPVGPYTPIVRAGDWLVVSGQLGRTGDGEFVAGGVGPQTARAVANIADLLAEQGARLSDVVKTTVLLASIDDYGVVNQAYVEAFADHRPARSAFATGGLPLGALVEIDAWAYSPR
ncbi:MAG: RidA family protein [Acidimicrobiales bacterium]